VNRALIDAHTHVKSLKQFIDLDMECNLDETDRLDGRADWRHWIRDANWI